MRYSVIVAVSVLVLLTAAQVALSQDDYELYLEAPLQSTAAVLDGVISPGEYAGTPYRVSFLDDDENPGRLQFFAPDWESTDADLSYDMYAVAHEFGAAPGIPRF